MDIKLKEITIAEIVDGFVDNAEQGVLGYGGKLNIRPAFQREFIYGEKQQQDVINTVLHGFPLNIMYWTVSGNGYELLDGQQRTLSLCYFYAKKLYIKRDNNTFFFQNLSQKEKDDFLNYKLMVYVCEGNDKEKLEWFQIINIAGKPLFTQEIRNAIYAGPWLTDAKKYFSKTGCPAHDTGVKYLSGSSIRQDYLETALSWIIDKEGVKAIEDYMAGHQFDTSANKLWLYFQEVMNWVKVTFPKWRKEMRSVPWGILYNEYGQKDYDSAELENKILKLLDDDDVTKPAGIYSYLITGEEKHLSIRAFGDKIKRKVYEKQKGKCKICKKQFEIEQMEADHITPWCEGGHTVESNCQMLCKHCNRTKSDK